MGLQVTAVREEGLGPAPRVFTILWLGELYFLQTLLAGVLAG